MSITGYAEDWKRIYLASYPRSGNHWVRYLVEDATGIATSSVYCDPDPQHLPDPFPWGGYCCDHGYLGTCRYPTVEDVVLLKTHGAHCYCAYDRQPSLCVIRLVRNPIDAIWSYYVYVHNGNPPSDIIDRTFLKDQIKNWKRFNRYWDNQPNVLTIRYEDLMTATFENLSKILHLVSPEVPPEKIQEAVQKFPPEGNYLKHIGHYNPKDLEKIYKHFGNDLMKWGYIY